MRPGWDLGTNRSESEGEFFRVTVDNPTLCSRLAQGLVPDHPILTTNRVSCVPGLLTVRSLCAFSVSLPRIEVVVQHPGDDKACRLEPRRWG